MIQMIFYTNNTNIIIGDYQAKFLTKQMCNSTKFLKNVLYLNYMMIVNKVMLAMGKLNTYRSNLIGNQQGAALIAIMLEFLPLFL